MGLSSIFSQTTQLLLQCIHFWGILELPRFVPEERKDKANQQMFKYFFWLCRVTNWHRNNNISSFMQLFVPSRSHTKHGWCDVACFLLYEVLLWLPRWLLERASKHICSNAKNSRMPMAIGTNLAFCCEMKIFVFSCFIEPMLFTDSIIKLIKMCI
jgi:hypothetical protein